MQTKTPSPADTECQKQPLPFEDYDPIKRDLEQWHARSRMRPAWQGD